MLPGDTSLSSTTHWSCTQCPQHSFGGGFWYFQPFLQLRVQLVTLSLWVRWPVTSREHVRCLHGSEDSHVCPSCRRESLYIVRNARESAIKKLQLRLKTIRCVKKLKILKILRGSVNCRHKIKPMFFSRNQSYFFYFIKIDLAVKVCHDQHYLLY